jgi:pimeloyl-ACP methyl ester carboxylesterase
MPRRHSLAICAAFVAALLVPSMAGAATTTRPAHKHYPVTWNFLAGALAAGARSGPGVAPAGSNLPCRPSAAHPRPVVLVHGLFANQSDNWAAMSPFLANHGYCVFSLTYGNDPKASGFMKSVGGLTDMKVSAHKLARFVRHVRHVTGAKKVDIVGHSEGGTVPDWYLKFDHGNRYVKHFVALSGVMHGTTVLVAGALYSLFQKLGFSKQENAMLRSGCASCTEFLPTSDWMRALDKPHRAATAHVARTCPVDGAAVAGVNYTSIATRYDELVWPATSDFINPACDGKQRIRVHNLLIQNRCSQDLSDHLSVAADPNVARVILNALDPGHRRPLHCRLVLPSIG